jgi:ethanolamine utilization protein EutQ (cupin superfamily)
MPLIHFDTKKITCKPLIETFVDRCPTPEVKEILKKLLTEKGFYDGIALDEPESKNIMAGVGKLDPGAGIPLVEKPIPWDELIYVIEGTMIGTSEGKTITAGPGECFYLSAGTPYAWGSETGCTVLYVAYPHWWKAIENAYKDGMLPPVE